jgi:Methyltransferase domain
MIRHKISFTNCMILAAVITCVIRKGILLTVLDTCSADIIKSTEFDLARTESLGFFTDITKASWERIKNLSHSRVHNMKGSINAEHPDRSYYQMNWDPDFSCMYEDSVGGKVSDGHKWICDPHRLAFENPCLIYSIGSNGDFNFEVEMSHIAPNCEIHTFDPGNYTPWKLNGDSINISYHEWGIKSTGKLQHDQPYKSLPETLAILGHNNTKIDVLKIDCEGCEWEVYKDILQIDARQIAVEVHNVNENTAMFFQALHDNGYVIFHKEPNIHGCSGDCVEFSFLKLSPSFFHIDS